MNTSPIQLKVLHIAPEMAPLAKQGGLGDVLGSLPQALHKSGIDTRVLLPAYPGLLEQCNDYGFAYKKLRKNIHVALNYRVYSAQLYQLDFRGVPIYLLNQPLLFDNTEIYPAQINMNTVLPFAFLSLAALELPSTIGWSPHILHVHDWPTAIVPAALKWHKYYKQQQKNYDVVFTIHNLAHQGILEKKALLEWGFDSQAMSIDALEFYGQCNLLKGALLSSDIITTVSPHYSWDIQTVDGGFGLHGVLSENKNKLYGILNGIDYDVWNPAKDTLIPYTFNKNNISGKRTCKQKLLHMCGWPDDGKPLLAFVGRLVEQKGIEVLLSALDWILVENCRMVLIGSGQQHYKTLVETFREKYSDYFWTCTEFNEDLAHLTYAGSDILVMPSLFEPCGLSQMIAMSYGTVPVVRATGGLADTVIDFDASHDGTGFLFSDFSAEELADAISRAITVYKNHEQWKQLINNCMSMDFSWKNSAHTYKELYTSLDEDLSINH